MMCLAGFVFVYPSDQIFIDSFFILDVLKLFKVERILKIKFQLLCKDNRNKLFNILDEFFPDVAKMFRFCIKTQILGQLKAKV